VYSGYFSEDISRRPTLNVGGTIPEARGLYEIKGAKGKSQPNTGLLYSVCHDVKKFLCHTLLLPWCFPQVHEAKQLWTKPYEFIRKINLSSLKLFLSDIRSQ
jgi:hypothetical protein